MALLGATFAGEEKGRRQGTWYCSGELWRGGGVDLEASPALALLK